jgi:hypothetical protein
MVQSRLGARRWLGVTAVVVMMFLTGCEDLLPLVEIEPPVDPGQVSLRPLLDADSLALPGIDTAEVIDVIGEPVSTETAKPPKEERPGTVSTLHYDGLDVVVHELREPRRTFISDLVISSPAYLTELKVGVGASRADVEQAFGTPSSTEGPAAVYELSDGGDLCTVTYDGDRATEFAFHFSWP